MDPFGGFNFMFGIFPIIFFVMFALIFTIIIVKIFQSFFLRGSEYLYTEEIRILSNRERNGDVWIL